MSISHFQEMNLPSLLKNAIEKAGFTTPTPIQAQAIPPAIEGKDVLGTARTGTGKTLAFVLPALNFIINNPDSVVLILTPTRELADQVHKMVDKVATFRLEDGTPIKTVLLIGQTSMSDQTNKLRNGAKIIIGTPGRVKDHMQRRTLPVNSVNFLVFDEIDRIFDMGAGDDLDQIVKVLPRERQTLMFSATVVPAVEKQLSTKYLKNPVRVAIESGIVNSTKLVEETVNINESDKYSTLLKEVNSREGTIIIFVKTKMGADRLSKRLCKDDTPAVAIHGDLRQHKRDKVMNAFRNGRSRIMVATDVASRGLDIPHIKHVINYDIPHSPEDYFHRVGRTARAGAEGSALSFISADDNKKWRSIQKLLHPEKFTGQDNEERDSSGRRRGFGGNGGKRSFGKKSFGNGGRDRDRQGSRDGRDNRGGRDFRDRDNRDNNREGRSPYRENREGSRDGASRDGERNVAKSNDSWNNKERSNDSYSRERKPFENRGERRDSGSSWNKEGQGERSRRPEQNNGERRGPWKERGASENTRSDRDGGFKNNRDRREGGFDNNRENPRKEGGFRGEQKKFPPRERSANPGNDNNRRDFRRDGGSNNRSSSRRSSFSGS